MKTQTEFSFYVCKTIGFLERAPGPSSGGWESFSLKTLSCNSRCHIMCCDLWRYIPVDLRTNWTPSLHEGVLQNRSSSQSVEQETPSCFPRQPYRLLCLLLVVGGLWPRIPLRTSIACLSSFVNECSCEPHFHSAITQPQSLSAGQLHADSLRAPSRMFTAWHRA